jgi:hypothetical protein
MGDGRNLSTLDFFMDTRYPWLSLAIPKLRELGYEAEVVSWADNNIQWDQKDLLVFASIWDYSARKSEFEAWLEKMKNLRIETHNSIDFLRWNYKKDYLLDLKQVGINIPPTTLVMSDSSMTLHDVVDTAISEWGTDDIIIKGQIDGGAFGYRHLNAKSAAEYEDHLCHLKKDKGGAVVQPFLPEISAKGEWAFVFFNDRYAYGFLKLPMQGDERVQKIHKGRGFHLRGREIAKLEALKSFRPEIVPPSGDEIQSAIEQAIDANGKLSRLLYDMTIDVPLYVRIDGVMVCGELQVMEIEGIEPYLEIKEADDTDPVADALTKYVAAIDHAFCTKTY